MRDYDLLHDVINYNTAIKACVKSVQRQHALAKFLMKRDNDLLPGVISYSSAVNACEKGEEWQHA